MSSALRFPVLVVPAAIPAGTVVSVEFQVAAVAVPAAIPAETAVLAALVVPAAIPAETAVVGLAVVALFGMRDVSELCSPGSYHSTIFGSPVHTA